MTKVNRNIIHIVVEVKCNHDEEDDHDDQIDNFLTSLSSSLLNGWMESGNDEHDEND